MHDINCQLERMASSCGGVHAYFINGEHTSHIPRERNEDGTAASVSWITKGDSTLTLSDVPGFHGMVSVLLACPTRESRDLAMDDMRSILVPRTVTRRVASAVDDALRALDLPLHRPLHHPRRRAHLHLPHPTVAPVAPAAPEVRWFKMGPHYTWSEILDPDHVRRLETVRDRPDESDDMKAVSLPEGHGVSRENGLSQFGAFGVRDIARGEVIADYSRGAIQRIYKDGNLVSNELSAYLYECWLTPTTIVEVDCNPLNSVAAMLNHGDGDDAGKASTSKKRTRPAEGPPANTVFVTMARVEGETRSLHIMLETLVDIPTGAELLLDYGDSYWEMQKQDALKRAKAVERMLVSELSVSVDPVRWLERDQDAVWKAVVEGDSRKLREVLDRRPVGFAAMHEYMFVHDINNCTSPLIVACTAGDDQCVAILVDRLLDVDVLYVDDDGDSALDVAVNRGHRGCAWIILDRLAIVDPTRHLRNTLQLLRRERKTADGAAATKAPQYIRELDVMVSNDATDDEIVNHCEKHAGLIHALRALCSTGRVDSMSALLDVGCPYETFTAYGNGETAFEMAAKHGHLECVTMMAEHVKHQFVVHSPVYVECLDPSVHVLRASKAFPDDVSRRKAAAVMDRWGDNLRGGIVRLLDEILAVCQP